MKTIFFLVLFILVFSLKAQIPPFTENDWTIEKIVTIDNSVIMADQLPDGSYDTLYIYYVNLDVQSFFYDFSGCGGMFNFLDDIQSFNIEQFECVITTGQTLIANQFVNNFVLQEGGEAQTPEGPVYGPFSYDFTYENDLVYLHITNLAGSITTFYANNLSQDEFLKASISIYPNPVKDAFHIDSAGIEIDTIKIYDLNGRLLKEQNNAINDGINVSALSQGVFILEIETSVGVLRKKMVKE